MAQVNSRKASQRGYDSGFVSFYALFLFSYLNLTYNFFPVKLYNNYLPTLF